MKEIDFDRLYEEIYQTRLNELEKKFEQYKSSHKHYTTRNTIIKFKEAIADERNNMIENHVPLQGSNGQYLEQNAFKKELVEKFESRNEFFAYRPITYFMLEILPDLKKDHLEKLESGNFKNDYQWDVDFIKTHTSTQIIEFLAKHSAYNQFVKKLHNEAFSIHEIDDELIAIPKTSLNWTGKDINDFVQLAYSLHLSGKINDGKGQRTKVVEELARALNVPLNPINWKSTHSKNINYTNRDYEPTIFDELRAAYNEYRKERIEKNKEKRRS